MKNNLESWRGGGLMGSFFDLGDLCTYNNIITRRSSDTIGFSV